MLCGGPSIGLNFKMIWAIKHVVNLRNHQHNFLKRSLYPPFLASFVFVIFL